MANLSNINNKFIVTDGNNGRVLVGATNDIGATLFANHPSTTAPSLTFNAPAGQVFENEDLQIAFGLNNASPYNAYMQNRFVSAPYHRNLAINPLGGNVGIGTNSPSQVLDVNGNIKVRGVSATKEGMIHNSGAYFSLVSTGDTSDTTGARIWLGNNASANAYYQNASTHYFRDLSSSIKMTLLSSGNLGIGTATPDTRLHIFEETNVASYDITQYPLKLEAKDTGGDFWDRMGAGIQFENTASSGSFISAEIIGQTTTSIGTRGNILFKTRRADTLTDAMIIMDSGKVGIGTTSPGSTLTLGNATGNVAELRVLRSNSLSTTYGFIGTVGGTVQLGGTGDTRITSVNGRLVFNSNNVDQISLEANGEYRLKLGSTTTGYEASMDNSNTAYRIFGSRFGGTGKYVSIWSDGANENTRFYPTLTTFYKMVGMRTTSPYSVLDVNGVITNRAADADPNFTVAVVGMSKIEGGSLQFTQGFAGTSSAGDTVVFRYNSVSWKSWALEFVFTSTGNGSGRHVCSGNIGGYNNNGSGYNSNFTQNFTTPVTVVMTNVGQNNVITFTGNFGIHMMCDMRYSQGGGDGAPRADRASLTYNS